MIGTWTHPLPYFHSDTETVPLWPSFYTIPWKLQCLEDYDSDQIAGNFKSNKHTASVAAGDLQHEPYDSNDHHFNEGRGKYC